jgi:hypothetical protein
MGLRHFGDHEAGLPRTDRATLNGKTDAQRRPNCDNLVKLVNSGDAIDVHATRREPARLRPWRPPSV